MSEAQKWADNWSVTELRQLRREHQASLWGTADDSPEQDFHVGVLEDLTRAIAIKEEANG